jgi:hypothetical protein
VAKGASEIAAARKDGGRDVTGKIQQRQLLKSAYDHSSHPHILILLAYYSTISSGLL